MLFFNLFTYEISIYKMVVNLQMTKEHLTHKHWSHIVPGIIYAPGYIYIRKKINFT